MVGNSSIKLAIRWRGFARLLCRGWNERDGSSDLQDLVWQFQTRINLMTA